jgi:hypothetical protein
MRVVPLFAIVSSIMCKCYAYPSIYPSGLHRPSDKWNRLSRRPCAELTRQLTSVNYKSIKGLYARSCAVAECGRMASRAILNRTGKPVRDTTLAC